MCLGAESLNLQHLPGDTVCQMLHVWSTAGQEVASIPVAELIDVRNLKLYLQGVCGVTRFRQKLLAKHGPLDDALKLESPADLQSVLLPFSKASTQEYQMLADAAHRSDLHLLEDCLQQPLHPDGIQHFDSDIKRRRIANVAMPSQETPDVSALPLY